MHWIRSIIQKETEHLKRLNPQSKQLLLAIHLYNVINPIFGIFVNAFLWRQTQDLALVAFFNLALFFGIPLGFYINGLLLRKLQSKVLFVLGLSISCIVVVSLTFLPRLNYESLAIFGLIYGISSGLFWSNRNLLTLKTTESNNRIYFTGMELVTKNIFEIIIPIIVGWYIVLGSKINLYSEIQAYQLIGIVMLLVAGAVGLLLRTLTVEITAPAKLTLKTSSPTWNKYRLIQIIRGFLNGITILIPTLLVLSYLGKEETLGTVQTVAAIITTAAVYYVGKSFDIGKRLLLLKATFIIGLLGASFFSIFFSSIGVMVFYVTQILINPLLWIAMQSLSMDLIDKNKDTSVHYAHLCDIEVFFNIGRNTAIFTFMVLVLIVGDAFALRYTPIIFALAPLLLVLLAKSIERPQA